MNLHAMNASAGALRICQFRDAEEREHEWYDEDGEEQYSSYVPKMLKRITLHGLPEQPYIITLTVTA